MNKMYHLPGVLRKRGSNGCWRVQTSRSISFKTSASSDSLQLVDLCDFFHDFDSMGGLSQSMSCIFRTSCCKALRKAAPSADLSLSCNKNCTNPWHASRITSAVCSTSACICNRVCLASHHHAHGCKHSSLYNWQSGMGSRPLLPCPTATASIHDCMLQMVLCC